MSKANEIISDKSDNKDIKENNQIKEDLKDNIQEIDEENIENIQEEKNSEKVSKDGKSNKVLKKLITVWLVMGVVVFLLYYANNKIDVTEHIYESIKVSNDLDGYTIVQISDLHNKVFGKNNDKLISKVKKAKPNMIVITGDIVDSNKTDVNVAINVAKRLRKIAIVYYVSGNHEYRISQTYRERLFQGLEDVGVIIMHNRLEIVNENLCVVGLDEEEVSGNGTDMYSSGNLKEVVDRLIKTADLGEDCLKILLAHEPQIYKSYVSSDIVFTGHAHGGQVRIPFINKGIVAPEQGFFPKYTEGRHDYKGTTMYISRGLGNSIIPQRIFNNPEIVKVTLKRKVNKNNKDV